MLTSCNGNGGGADSSGPIYLPVGTTYEGTPSGGTPSGNTDEGKYFTAQDILDLSNAGDTETIIRIFSTASSGQSQAESQTVVLKASDIGLPDGGSATLTISGGATFSATAQADADGNVTFQVPPIPSGTAITVALFVKNASGTVLYSGSSQQTVSGDSININLTLRRQYWTLPDSIRVTASPDGLLYNALQLDSVGTTLTISGLEDAPSDASISYSWTDESGNELGTGATLTRTLNELIGSTTMTAASELTRIYTVIVSYTDVEGNAKTASADASVTVGPPVTIPDFTVNVVPPATYMDGKSAKSGGIITAYALADLMSAFSFTPVPAAGESFPAGTTFEWSVTAGGSSYAPANTAVGENCSVIPSANLGLSESTIGRTSSSATAISVTCTAKNSRAPANKPGTPASTRAFLLYSLPASISLTASPDGFEYDGTKLSETTTLSISGLEDAPAEIVLSYAWELDSSSLADTGSTLTRSWSELIGPTAPSSDLTKTFTVTVSYTDETGDTQTVSASTSVVIGGPIDIPSFSITVGKPATCSSTSSPYALKNLSSAFSFTPEAEGGSFPAGTTFEWSISAGGGSPYTPADTGIGEACTASPTNLGLTESSIGRPDTSPTTISVSCTAKNSRALDKPGSTSVSVCLLYTMPDFTISISAPATATGSSPYGLTSLTDDFTLTAMPSGGSFPPGTTFLWTYGSTTIIEAVDATSCTLAPSVMGITASSPGSAAAPKSEILGCRASNPNAVTDKLGGNPSLSAYYKVPLNAPSLSLTTEGLIVDSEGNNLVDAGYGLNSAKIHLSASGSQPAGVTVKYEWYMNGVRMTAYSNPTSTADFAPSLAGCNIYSSGDYSFTCRVISDDPSYTPSAFSNSVSIKIGDI